MKNIDDFIESLCVTDDRIENVIMEEVNPDEINVYLEFFGGAEPLDSFRLENEDFSESV